MIVYVNDRNEIHDVNTSDNPSLTALHIDDSANPFEGWSDIKICCYKCTVVDGKVTMMTPYVDTRILEHLDQAGKQAEAANNLAVEDDNAVIEVAGFADENASAIEELAAMIDEMQAQVDELKGGN